MKKVGIITIIDNNNCGNRLQNFALQKILQNLNCETFTLKNETFLNWDDMFYKGILRFLYKRFKSVFKVNKNFKFFNKNINFYQRYITIKSKYISKKFDYFVAGSDQIWKPTRRRLSKVDLLAFANPEQRISYAASFGLDSIDTIYYKTLNEELPKFKFISVREDSACSIIKKATGIENVSVVLDPTMLLNEKEWLKIEKKPIDFLHDNYVFTYFLGHDDSDIFVNKLFGNKYKIINYNKGSYGPSEFLYLIRNADYILTDSFHGTVFSILFKKEFYVFNRKQEDLNNNMNSRLDTLLCRLGILNRKINNINDINLNFKIDYDKVYENLKIERLKSIEFLKNAIDYK